MDFAALPTANGHEKADAVPVAMTKAASEEEITHHAKGTHKVADTRNVADTSPTPTDPTPTLPPGPASDTGADAGSDVPANPRKRKKASRACDFCHTNHQPCDNGKPKCSVCVKHKKECTYNRPTKRRGPQKGYRTALNVYKEAAAAWGAVLAAIPGLDDIIEGHLRAATGQSIIDTIKDTSQQDEMIKVWQQSAVHLAIFGYNGPAPGTASAAAAEDENPDAAGDSQPSADNAAAADDSSSKQKAAKQPSTVSPDLTKQARHRRERSTSITNVQTNLVTPQVGMNPAIPAQAGMKAPVPTAPMSFDYQHHLIFPSGYAAPSATMPSLPPIHTTPTLPTDVFAPLHPNYHPHPPPSSYSGRQVQSQPQDLTLSDLVARDAESQLAARTSRTLGSLGFASDETITDFYAMGENPDPVPDESSRDPDFDPSLGTEDEQRAYYELLMGRKFSSDRSTKH